MEDSLLREKTFTENVSARGARVVTKQAWQVGTEVIVISSHEAVRLRAKIAYCEALGIGRFVIGLELSASAGEWQKPVRSA